MLSCLSLLRHTHVRVASHGDYHRTACGLSVIDESAVFAETADQATCDKCRHSLEAGGGVRENAALSADPKSVVARLVDEVLNTRGWHATIDDQIAEGGRVVVFYRVDCGDASGLVEPAATNHTNSQSVILHIAGGRIVHARPIVDDFDLWAGR